MPNMLGQALTLDSDGNHHHIAHNNQDSGSFNEPQVQHPPNLKVRSVPQELESRDVVESATVRGVDLGGRWVHSQTGDCALNSCMHWTWNGMSEDNRDGLQSLRMRANPFPLIELSRSDPSQEYEHASDVWQNAAGSLEADTVHDVSGLKSIWCFGSMRGLSCLVDWHHSSAASCPTSDKVSTSKAKGFVLQYKLSKMFLNAVLLWR